MDGTEQSTQFLDGLLFPKILQSFRMAIQPSKLIIAFGAILVIFLAGWLMDFSRTVVATPGMQGQETELQIYMSGPERLDSYIERYGDAGENCGVFTTLWTFARGKFHGALKSLFAFDLPGVARNVADYLNAVVWATKYHYIYSIFFCLIELAVIAVAGGAICRIAALQFARNEKPGLGEALRYSLKKFTSFFFTPLGLAILVVIPCVPILLLGLLANIPVAGEVVLVIFMLCALVLGAIIAVVLIGTVAGFNLMFPAIAYDGADVFDAIGRAYSYVCARPWRLGFYYAVAIVYGAICYIFVRFVAFVMLWVTHALLCFAVWANSAGGQPDKIMAIWPEPSFMKLHTLSTLAANRWESFIAYIVYLIVMVVIGLLVSFITSYYFSASTIIYALMRKKVDNTPLDDIYIYRAEPKLDEPAEPTEPTKPTKTKSSASSRKTDSKDKGDTPEPKQ